MCCGRKPTANPRASAGPRPAQVVFQYVGRTGLTVSRTPTGTVYRFGRPGARLVVDARDRQALAAVPGLRAIG